MVYSIAIIFLKNNNGIDQTVLLFMFQKVAKKNSFLLDVVEIMLIIAFVPVYMLQNFSFKEPQH